MPLILLFLIVSCASSDRIRGSLCPVERSDVEVNNNTAIIRTLYFDCYLQILPQRTIKKILSYDCFTNYHDGIAPLSTAVIIHNTSDELLTNISCTITAADSITLARTQPAPEKSFYTPRRIFFWETTIDTVDFDQSSNVYLFDYIIPGDQILFFYGYDSAPPKTEKLTVTVELMIRGVKKTVAFDFRYIEHRLD